MIGRVKALPELVVRVAVNSFFFAAEEPKTANTTIAF